MARRPTGSLIPPKGKQRSWALRFTAYGKRRYVSLGRPEDGWDRTRAEAELRHTLADVERGLWRPHDPAPVDAPPEVSFQGSPRTGSLADVASSRRAPWPTTSGR